MGFGLIAAGLIFLFNPNISVLDVLPDCIGYFLIFRGLFAMSFASPKLAEARGGIGKLMLITALRFFSILLLPLTSDTFNLVLVFVFGVLEAVYFIPTCLLLFEGFYGLGNRFDTQSVYGVREIRTKQGERKTVEVAEGLKIFTVIFFLVKTVAAILPELTALQIGAEYSEAAKFDVNLARFKPLFYGFCVGVTLIFGIIWLIRFWRYAWGMKKDGELAQGIQTFFTENIASDPGLMAALRMKRVHLLFILAAVGTLTFVVEGVDILPNAAAAVSVILALLMMRKDETSKLLLAAGFAVSGAVGLLSIGNIFLQIPYFEEYEAVAARHISGAAEAYKAVRFWGTAEAVIVMAMFVLLWVIYGRVIKRHSTLVEITGNVTQYNAESRRAELCHAVYGRLFTLGVVGVIYLGVGVAYFTAYMYIPEMHLISDIIALVFIAVSAQLGSSAYENIYERLEQKY